MNNFPTGLAAAFALTTALALGLFYHAAHRSLRILGVLLAWMFFLGALAVTGFFTVTDSFPPRLAFVLGPALLVILSLCATARGRNWMNGLCLETLTLLHVVRVPVELVLYGLFLHGAVPQLMTFEGRNWDVLAGLTAPVVFYLFFRQQSLGRKGLLIWNILSLASLLNIVVTAVLSAPSSFQRLAFEQPNVAVLHFPFVWLPGCVVPLVLLAHLAAIWQLAIKKVMPKAAPLSSVMAQAV